MLDGIFKKKYYCIKQHDMSDCGAACIATISKQYGLKLSITSIREIAGTDTQGTNAYGLIKAAEELGFSAKGVQGDKEAFFSPLPLPCIGHVVVKGSLQHYVVIHKITKKEIIIADPGRGIVELTPEEFFGISRDKSKPPMYQWTGVLILITPTVEFKRGDKTKGTFLRFFSLLLPQKKLILNVYIASLLSTALGVFGAFYFKYMVDELIPYERLNTLHIISLAVIILNVFNLLLGAIRTHLLLYLSQKLDIALLLGYYNHILSLPMNFFGTRKVGEIVSRFNDASSVRDAISTATLTIMIDVLMAFFGAIVLYTQNSYMFMVTFIIAIIYFIIVVSFNNIYRRLNLQQMEDNAEMTSYLVESLNGIQTIKAYNGERNAKLNNEKKFIKTLKSTFNLSWVANLQGTLTNITNSIGGIIILWVGGYNVIQGNISLGQLITFNSLLVYFLDPVRNLINLQPTLQTAITASERLGEIMDLEPEHVKHEGRKMRPPSLKSDILIKNLYFRYGTRAHTLENISMYIKQGEKIALVGESGSGKTTFAKLLLNLYQPESGEISIGSMNIQDIQLESLRDRIAYVPQQVFLFTGSIFENLVFGIEGATYEDVVRVSKMAQAHEFINALPLRYETILEENGSNLSGGQRQRLAITRALLKKPDILILDEATSNLDSITEQALEKMINAYTVGITTIIIAHRLSTIKKCDRIFVMEDGKIIEAGTHFRLMELRGAYFKFVSAQSLEDVI